MDGLLKQDSQQSMLGNAKLRSLQYSAVTAIFYPQVKAVFALLKNIMGQRDAPKQCVPIQMFWHSGPLVEAFQKHNIPALKVLSNEKKGGVVWYQLIGIGLIYISAILLACFKLP